MSSLEILSEQEKEIISIFLSSSNLYNLFKSSPNISLEKIKQQAYDFVPYICKLFLTLGREEFDYRIWGYYGIITRINTEFIKKMSPNIIDPLHKLDSPCDYTEGDFFNYKRNTAVGIQELAPRVTFTRLMDASGLRQTRSDVADGQYRRAREWENVIRAIPTYSEANDEIPF